MQQTHLCASPYLPNAGGACVAGGGGDLRHAGVLLGAAELRGPPLVQGLPLQQSLQAAAVQWGHCVLLQAQLQLSCWWNETHKTRMFDIQSAPLDYLLETVSREFTQSITKCVLC